MTPSDIARIQKDAETAERMRIVQGIRLLAVLGRQKAKAEGRDPNSCSILDRLAEMIEDGEIGQ